MISLLKRDLYEFRFINILLIIDIVISLILSAKVYPFLLQFLALFPIICSFIYRLNYSEECFPYLASLPINRKDLVNYKYLITIVLYILSIILFVRVASYSKGNINDFSLVTAAMIFLTSIYSLLIPIQIKYGRESYINSIIFILPVALKPLVTFFRKYFINIDKLTLTFIFLGAGIFIFILSYIWARKVIEYKEF